MFVRNVKVPLEANNGLPITNISWVQDRRVSNFELEHRFQESQGSMKTCLQILICLCEASHNYNQEAAKFREVLTSFTLISCVRVLSLKVSLQFMFLPIPDNHVSRKRCLRSFCQEKCVQPEGESPMLNSVRLFGRYVKLQPRKLDQYIIDISG